LEVWSELHHSQEDPSLALFLISPFRLVKLRDIVLARPFINETNLIEAGHAQVMEDEARNAVFLQSVHKKAKGTKKRVAEENVRETRKAEEAARQGHDKVLEMQNELRLATEKQAPKNPASTQGDKGATVPHISPASTSEITMSETPIASARVATSKSSKLNYLLKEV
jgi:hypothetical protein